MSIGLLHSLFHFYFFLLIVSHNMAVAEFRNNSLGSESSAELCSAFNLSFWGGDWPAAAMSASFFSVPEIALALCWPIVSKDNS